MARNIAVACYFIWQDIQTLKATVSTNAAFKDFYDRKDKHMNNKEIYTLLYSNLPALVFKEVEQVFQKHFTQ